MTNHLCSFTDDDPCECGAVMPPHMRARNDQLIARVKEEEGGRSPKSVHTLLAYDLETAARGVRQAMEKMGATSEDVEDMVRRLEEAMNR